MSKRDKGKGNFYRMSTGILDYGTKCKRQLLEKHLKESKLSFKDFLKKHQHILYHLCFNRKCSCIRDCYLPRNKILRPQQLELLFERKSATRLPCHKGGPVDFCCCDVQQNANVEDLDFTFVHCILVNCCVDEFWNCCLTSTKLEPFLNRNKHDIFHLWMSTTKCSLCGPNYIFPESNLKLHQHQWEILYSPANDPQHATANIGIKIKHLDHELACAILNILCPLKVNVDKLTKIRNTMYGHATKGEIDQNTFKEKWGELKKCLLYIAKHCNREKEFIEDLENLQKRSLDAGLCEEFRISLLRSGEEREVNIIRSLTLNKTFKQTAVIEKVSSIATEIKSSNQLTTEKVDSLCAKVEESLSKMETYMTVKMKTAEPVQSEVAIPPRIRNVKDIVTSDWVLQKLKEDYEKRNSLEKRRLCNERKTNEQDIETSIENMENALNLRAKEISPTSVQVLWSNERDPGLEKYQLHYKPSNSDCITYRMILNDKSTFEITNLDPDTEYYVSLTPHSNNRKLKPSVTCVRTPQLYKTAVLPRILDARMLTKTSLIVSCLVHSQRDYLVQCRSVSSHAEVWIQPMDSKKNKVEISGLTENRTYEVSVGFRSDDKSAAHFSSWVKVFSFEEWYRRPKCPTNLRFKSNKNVAVLQWSIQQHQDIHVTEFIVGCGIVADGRHIYRVGPDKTEFEFVDLDPNTDYIFSVRAVNKFGNSEAAFINVTTGIMIKPEDIDSDSSSETEPEDELKCGKCKSIYHSLKKFLRHKATCKKKNSAAEDNVKSQQDGALVLKFEKPVSKSVLTHINKCRNKLSSNGIHVLQADTGSLVIWTRISKELFQSKEIFLNRLQLFLQHFFLDFKLEISDLEIDVKVQISDEETEDDERDTFKCGRCSEVFVRIDEFWNHSKRRNCKRHIHDRTVLYSRELEEQGDESFIYRMEPEIANVTDMTEFLRVVENMPDHDMHFRNGKTLTIKVNPCNTEDQTVRNVPRYPQMRLDPHPLSKKMKVASLEHDNGAEYAPILLSTNDRPDFSSNPPHVEKKDQLIYVTWEGAQQRIGMPVSYTVEMFLENHSNEWFMSETGISSNYVYLEDIFPTESCSFRVIAENEAGKSLPTMPTLLERHSQTPSFPTEKPDMILNERIATLRWKSAITTLELIKYPVTYSIEVSTDRGRIWVQLIADLQQTYYNFDIVDLDLGTLYQFRVKAHNAFGSSRATNPLEFLRGFWITRSSLRENKQEILKRRRPCDSQKQRRSKESSFDEPPTPTESSSDEPATKTKKFGCSVTLEKTWSSDLNDPNSLAYKKIENAFAEEMFQIYKKQLPEGTDIKIDVINLRAGSIHVDFRVIINYPKKNSISKDELVIATKQGHRKHKNNKSSVFSCMDFKSFQISQSEQQELQRAQVALINDRHVLPSTSIVVTRSTLLSLQDIHTTASIKKCVKINDVFIFMDNHSQLFAYKSSKLDFTLNENTYLKKWHDEPIDLAVINFVETGSFGIALLFCNRIRSLNVSDFGVFARGRKLKIPKRIQYALAFWANSFYVANQNSNAVNISLFNSSDGQLSNTVHVCYPISKHTEVQLTVRENIYCNVYDPAAEEMKRNTIYCFDEKTSNVLWLFSDNSLRRLYGITTDQCKNVYVTNGNHLTVISNNGRCYNILLNSISPSSDVYFDVSEQCLVMCTEKGTIKLMHMSIMFH